MRVGLGLPEGNLGFLRVGQAKKRVKSRLLEGRIPFVRVGLGLLRVGLGLFEGTLGFSRVKTGAISTKNMPHREQRVHPSHHLNESIPELFLLFPILESYLTESLPCTRPG